ncbi:MAG: M20/M25/M40 family metallo-hydrolase [Acidobacteriota bacterium]
MTRKMFGLTLACVLVIAVSAAPQQPPAQNPPGGAPGQAQSLTVWVPHTVTPEKLDADLNAKIRTEGMEHSKIMWIEHMLADVYGPRPTGSPSHEAAANWAIKTMQSWGMTNAHLEPWDWGHEGWLNERASGFLTSPVKANLKFEVVAWSPSTNGTVSGPVVKLVPPHGPMAPAEPMAPAAGGRGGSGGPQGPTYLGPTEAELNTYLIDKAPLVKGGIVMVGDWTYVPINFTEPQKRIADDVAKARYMPPDPNAPRGRGFGVFPGGGGRGGGAAPAADGRLTTQQVNQRIATFLRDNPPALRLNDAARAQGIIVGQNPPSYDHTTQVPGVILRNDDYGRISRIIDDGTAVTVEFNIVNHYYPEGKMSYNTIAEIPGSDKADEVVMLGGHLDSWHTATGAADNAIGCAIMMEAARILETVGVKPRRTIRVALWGGEEEGLLGSIAYVKQHFGSAEAPTKEWAKLDAYWNIDSGTGRVRGASIFGPPEAGVILAQFFKPFEEWGIYGAVTTVSRVTSGTDSTSFNNGGLPGIGTQQDPIEYNSITHHTNLDTYERIIPDDVMKDAVITASVVYHIANRDKMMPRFAPDEMPALPAARGGGAAGGRGGNAGPSAESHIFAAAKNKALAVAAPGLLGAGAAAGQAAVTSTGSIDTNPTHGKVTLKPDGSFVYTPDKDFAGADSFTYKISSGGVTSTAGTVTLVVK